MAINIPPLLASDGELAVIYRTASFLWGKWTVAYPEGVEPKDFEYGRALGYVGRLERPLAGRGSLRWMRTDVSINADAKFSEVPSAFAAAEKRTAGDVLFDAVIGEEGYGNLVPGVDLKVGDEVPVLLGGSKMLDLPVREIKPVVDGARLRFEVSVGGELTDQPAALDEYNNSIFATITEEQVKLQKELAAQRKQAELDKRQWSAIGDAALQLRVQQGKLSDQQGLMDRQQDDILAWSDTMAQLIEICAGMFSELSVTNSSEWRVLIRRVQDLGTAVTDLEDAVLNIDKTLTLKNRINNRTSYADLVENYRQQAAVRLRTYVSRIEALGRISGVTRRR